MTLVERARKDQRAKLTDLANAHQVKSRNDTIPACEDALLVSRVKFWIAKTMAQAKRPLSEADRQEICDFLAIAVAETHGESATVASAGTAVAE